MRKRFYTAFVFMLAAAVCKSQSYISLDGTFGQPTQQISELTDVLYRATERFTVTPSLPGLFQGMINDVSWVIAAGAAPATLTIDFTTKGELPGSGLLYPEGYVYLSFYAANTPLSVSGRAKNNATTWYNLMNWTNISNNPSFALWRGQMPSFNNMTVLELTITPRTTGPTWVSKVEFHRNRPGADLQPAFFSKYWENKVYNNLTFADNNNVTNLKLKNDGGAFFNSTVGIGTSTPSVGAKLDVNGNIFSTGKIAIGTTDMDKIAPYALAVNGEAIFNKARVKLYGVWPDFVFHKNYRLPPLAELERYIKKNNHLPHVPSAKQVAEEGIDLGGNQAILLHKIEELTLYMIAQQKELARQQEKLELQQKEIERLKKNSVKKKG